VYKSGGGCSDFLDILFLPLPIWTLAGVETYQMIGLPAMPFITNACMNGIKNFDADYAMEAMRVSAMKDTCGFSWRVNNFKFEYEQSKDQTGIFGSNRFIVNKCLSFL